MSEIQTMRLIDANALKARLIKYHDGFSEPCDAHTMGMMVAIRECIDRIQSAPTVETTDDVLARLPLGVKVFKYDNGDGTFRIKATAHDYEKKYLNPWAYGETAIEAVKKIEERINPVFDGWIPFVGDYEKKWYDVLTNTGEIVPHCWPNAGFLTETSGSQRRWGPDSKIEFRLSATHPMGGPQE